MDELRSCSLTPKNFYETTSVFLPPSLGASSTGMLASRPTGLGVPPRSTTIVYACTPLASAAEGDKWRPTRGDRTVSDLQITQLLPIGCGRMPVIGRGETPAQQQPHSTSGNEWQVRFNTLSGERDHPTDRMSTNADDSDVGRERRGAIADWTTAWSWPFSQTDGTWTPVRR